MKICFVMPGSHHIFYRGTTPGGAEWQMVLLARGLARQGHAVTFLTANPGGKKEAILDGVLVDPAFPHESSGRFLLFRTWLSLRKALDQVNAEIWIQRAASPLTGLMAGQARQRGAAFVYMISNDSNVNGVYERRSNLRDRWLYRRGLREAAGIVAQSETQARLLRDQHGLDAVVIPSAVPAPPDPLPAMRPEQVLWAATFQRHKRPHLILDLARRAPDLIFAVAGNPSGEIAYGRQFESDAKSMSNIRLLGRLDRTGMEAEYIRSIALLSTSEHEGVSNTFLEAWRFGVPVVSLAADPDEVICSKGLGLHTGDFDQVIEGLRRFRDDPEARRTVAVAARRHLELHDEDAVAARLAAWLETLLTNGGH